MLGYWSIHQGSLGRNEFNGEIHLADAMSKLDEIYGVRFEHMVFNIENRLKWIKSSFDYAMVDDKFRDDLISYMKTFAVNLYVIQSLLYF